MSEVVVGGRYRLVRLIGRGGMGEVWAARRAAIEDLVALKRLLPGLDTQSARRRFAVEGQAAAHIRHPNVVQIYDSGEDPAIGPYLVMELLDGHALSDEVRAGALPMDRVRWIFAAVCAAVEAGHRRGIVHRDLKPANVFVARSDDDREQIKVVDFGIALDTARDDRITKPGAVVGTASYLAPELCEGRAATTASDVYALGVILYELVTGQKPFGGRTPVETMLAIAGGRYVSPRDHAPGVPDEVVHAIGAALAREPSRRPVSPDALARVLLGAQPPPMPRAPAPARRRPTTRGTPAPDQTADTGDPAPVFARFVGRARELARIDDEYQAALAGRGRIVLVTGEPGAGKSRLLERASIAAGERGAAVLAARFVDPSSGRPPPLSAFTAFGATAADDLDLGGGAASDDRWRAFAAITDAVDAQALGRPLVLALDDVHFATRLDLDVIAHLHRELGPRGVLVVCAASTADDRTELTSWRVARGASLTEVPLPALHEDDVRAWLAGVFRRFDARPLDVRRLVRATAGNPYALGELARHLVARGAIRPGEHGWRLDPDADLELPEGVAQLWRVRLSELAIEHRRVLEVAAVLGDELRLDTLAVAARDATGADDPTIDAAVDAAFARRLLTDRGCTPGHDARFTSAPVRNVLLADLAPRARRRAHQAAIAALTGTRTAPALVDHLHAIGDWPGAVRAGVRAAAAARARFDLDAAAAALAKAEDALARAEAEAEAEAEGLRPQASGLRPRSSDGEGLRPRASGLRPQSSDTEPDDVRHVGAHSGNAEDRGPRTEDSPAPSPSAKPEARGPRPEASSLLLTSADRAALDREAGALALADGALDRAAHRLRAAANAAANLGDAALEADALVDLARTHLAEGEHAKARAAAAEAGAAAERAGSRSRALAARAAHAEIVVRQGGDLPALDALVEDLGDEDPANLRSRVHRARAWARLKKGDWTGAGDDARRALDLARAAGDLAAHQLAVAALSAIRNEGGDPTGAVDTARESLALARRLGDRRREAICMANLADTLLGAGEVAEAEALLRDALAIFLAIGDDACEGDCRVNLGRALVAAGRAGDARDTLERGIALCAATGRREFEGVGHLYLGDALLDADPAAALLAYRRAIEILASMSSHQRWRAELGAARACRALGDAAGATDHADAARAHVEALRARLPAGHDARFHRAALAEIDRA